MLTVNEKDLEIYFEVKTRRMGVWIRRDWIAEDMEEILSVEKPENVETLKEYKETDFGM